MMRVVDGRGSGGSSRGGDAWCCWWWCPSGWGQFSIVAQSYAASGAESPLLLARVALARVVRCALFLSLCAHLLVVEPINNHNATK